MTLLVKNPPDNSGDTRDAGSIPGSRRSPGRGHGNPLQHSCLENPVDRRAWRATVHRVARAGHDRSDLNAQLLRLYQERSHSQYLGLRLQHSFLVDTIQPITGLIHFASLSLISLGNISGCLNQMEHPPPHQDFVSTSFGACLMGLPNCLMYFD